MESIRRGFNEHFFISSFDLSKRFLRWKLEILKGIQLFGSRGCEKRVEALLVFKEETISFSPHGFTSLHRTGRKSGLT